jgi:hypothetical protein
MSALSGGFLMDLKGEFDGLSAKDSIAQQLAAASEFPPAGGLLNLAKCHISSGARSAAAIMRIGLSATGSVAGTAAATGSAECIATQSKQPASAGACDASNCSVILCLLVRQPLSVHMHCLRRT